MADRLDSLPRVCDPGGVARVGALVEQMRRAVRDPGRLRRLHYSSVVAAVHGIVEPDDAGVLARVFGVGREEPDRLVSDLVRDGAFADAIDRRHRAVRGTPLRLFADASERDAEMGLVRKPSRYPSAPEAPFVAPFAGGVEALALR